MNMWKKYMNKNGVAAEPLPRISRIIKEAQKKGLKQKPNKKEIIDKKRRFQTYLAKIGARKTRVRSTSSLQQTRQSQHSVNHAIHQNENSDGQVASSSTGFAAEYHFTWDDEERELTDTDKYYLDKYNLLKHSKRKTWPKRLDFIMMLVGYTIGLGNVWRFPYLCHKNGGASFLIPYVIFLLAEGIPLYYMELCLGQRLRKGSIGVWHIVSPYLDGLGISSCIVCFFVCLYYNVIGAWCLFYFANSFKNPLPWSVCPNITITYDGNQTVSKVVEECQQAGSTNYFWYRTTLNISDSIESGSEINWQLAAALLVAWVLCWFCLLKRIKSEGKVAYITATVPLILLGVMFFRGVHLPGFQEGLAILFIPDFDKLKNPLVWMEAASQTFYSLGIAYGTLIALASYNPLKNDTTSDALLLCLIDCGVSIYASIVIFCFIGYRAHQQMEDCLAAGGSLLNATGVITDSSSVFLSNNISLTMSRLINVTSFNATHVQNTTTSTLVHVTSLFDTTKEICDKRKFLDQLSHSTGLAFITFTEAINSLPHPQLWSILFFLMLFLLAIDTQFGMLEGLLTPVFDAKLFPKLRTEVITGIVCLTIYILSLSMVTSSGNYWFQLIENYSAGIPLLVIALGQCLAVSYVYGIDRFSNDIEYMTNKRPHRIWIVCWKLVSPLLIVIVLLFSIHGLLTSTPTYQVWDAKLAEVKSIPLPSWAFVVGVMLMLVSMLFIPIVAFLRYFNLIEAGKKGITFLSKKRQSFAGGSFEKHQMTEMNEL